MNERTKSWLLGLALALLTLLAYSGSFHNGYIWDDDKYVYENPLLTQPGSAGLRDIWLKPSATPQYYPLVYTTFWIEHRLWGIENPGGFHAVNVALHAASAVLAWLALRRLRVPGAWLIAAVFAVHPVMVESVAWVTERKNTLSLFFYLLALHCWLTHSPPDEDRPARERRWVWYGLALIAFVAALLSKTVSCTLPAALGVVIWWKRGVISRRDLAALTPMLLIGVSMGLNTAMLERQHVGAEGAEWAMSVFDRLVLAGNVASFYAWKLVLPTNLTFIYPRWNLTASNPAFWPGPIVVVAVTALLFILRKKVTRGPLAGWFFFLGTLFPALGFFNVYPFRFSFVADHFQYHASLGFLAMAVGSLVAWLAPVFEGRNKLVPLGLSAGLLAVLITGTRAQTVPYFSAQTIWEDTIAKNPDAWIAHNNLGSIYQEQGNLPLARDRFADSVRLGPHVVEARMNLGTVLIDLDQPSAAAAEFTAATELFRTEKGEKDPRRGEPWLLRSVAERRAGRREESIASGRTAREIYAALLQISPRSSFALYGLGRALLSTGDYEQSIQALGQMLGGMRDPTVRSQAMRMIGEANLALGRASVGIQALEAALREWPGNTDAALTLATALSAGGDGTRNGARALAMATAACENVGGKSPGYVRCLLALSAAYAETGAFDRAEKASRAGADMARQWKFETLPSLMESRAAAYAQRRALRLTGAEWVW